MNMSQVKNKKVLLLEKQIKEIDKLKELRHDSPKFYAWKRKTASLLERIFGKNSRQLKDFEITPYSPDFTVFSDSDPIWQEIIHIKGLEEARAILESIKDELIEFQELDRPTERYTNKIDTIRRIFYRFDSIVRQLRHRYNNRETIDVNDEYDVQDLLHALLKLFFDDIRPEEWTPSYAGKSARTDFLLKKEKIVIEVKKTRKGLSDKEIGNQLILDIERYRNHPDCDYLMCFIYDPEGRISNPSGFESDLSRNEKDFKVSIYIRP